MKPRARAAILSLMAACGGAGAGIAAQGAPPPAEVAPTDGGDDPRSLDLPASGGEAPISIPVSVALEDIDPAGMRRIRVMRTRGSLVALTDSYASKPQGMSYCQAGEEVYFRVVDKAARKERYSKLIDSCLGRALSVDPPVAWKSTYTATLNLLREPAVTVTLGADGTVTHTP